MKIRPGIVTAREIAKNQFLFPMMSNTPAGLSSEATRHGPSDELRFGHAVQPRLARRVPRHDEPEHGPRDRDRREHRDEDADDQRQAEAADRRRPEQEQDRRGDEA